MLKNCIIDIVCDIKYTSQDGDVMRTDNIMMRADDDKMRADNDRAIAHEYMKTS